MSEQRGLPRTAGFAHNMKRKTKDTSVFRCLHPHVPRIPRQPWISFSHPGAPRWNQTTSRVTPAALFVVETPRSHERFIYFAFATRRARSTDTFFPLASAHPNPNPPKSDPCRQAAAATAVAASATKEGVALLHECGAVKWLCRISGDVG